MLSSVVVCLVIGITDGDTIKARCGAPGAYQQVTVRIAAIDAPERRQPFGQASRQHLAALCFDQRAQITPRTTDRYGRMVGDVSCQGRDAGADLVAQGIDVLYVLTGVRTPQTAGSLSLEETELLTLYKKADTQGRDAVQAVAALAGRMGGTPPKGGNVVSIGGNVKQSIAGNASFSAPISFDKNKK